MNEMKPLEKQKAQNQILKRRKAQSGQAVVETILLIAIGVVLILGLMKEFYQPFGTWVKTYMTSYLECLLDVGELPTLGSASVTSVCVEQFKAFKKGAPYISSASSGGSSGGSAGGAGAGAGAGDAKPRGGPNSNKASASRGSDSAADGRSHSAGDGTVSGGLNGQANASRRRGFGEFDGNKKSDVSEESANLSEAEKEKRANRGGTRSFSLGSNAGGDSTPISQFSERTASSESKKKTSVNFSISSTEDERTSSLSSKKFIMTNNPRKLASETTDFQWGIADYLKYAVILAIVLATILFLGGQIAQISKSMEKK